MTFVIDNDLATRKVQQVMLGVCNKIVNSASTKELIHKIVENVKTDIKTN